MTKLLEKAVYQASQLPDSGQDAIATWILEEIRRYQDIRNFAERFGGTEIDLDQDLVEEAGRQSILVSQHESERDTLDFIEHAADTRGWE